MIIPPILERMDNLREQYITWCRDVKGLRPKTLQATEESFMAFFDKYEGELTLESFEGFIAWMKKAEMSTQTIVSRGGHIRRLIQFASRKEYCTDFSRDIFLPRIHFRPPEALRLKEVQWVIDSAGEILGTENKKIQYNKVECKDALSFCLRTALRKSELLALKPSDFRLADNCFFVETSKSYKTVSMPLPLDMVEMIKSRMDRKYIFEPTDPGVLDDFLHRGSKKTGISKRLTCHDLRRACIMDWFRRSINIQTIKDLARHADYSSLGKYSASMLEERALAVNSSELTATKLNPQDALAIVKKKILETGILNNENLVAEVTERKGEFLFRVVY